MQQQRKPGNPWNSLNPDVVCSLGRMKIPGEDQWYIANQFHLHSNSEHSVSGSWFPAELHVVHVREDHKSFAVFGMFLDTDNDINGGTILDEAEAADVDKDKGRHEIFDYYLQGWEAIATQSEEYCASNPSGHGQFTPNQVFTSKEELLQCPPVGSSVESVDDLTFVEEEQLLPFGWNVTHTVRVPELKQPDFPAGKVPSLYESLPSYPFFPPSGSDISKSSNESIPLNSVYSYRGGLTTPPCTEGVKWNILSQPMKISKYQLNRLVELILCFVERSTCRHATTATHFGGTNRPVQPLMGREVTHRCPRAEDVANITTQPTAALYVGSDNSVKDDPPAEVVSAPYARRCLNVQSPYQNNANCVPIDEESWIAILWPTLTLIVGVMGYIFLTRYFPSFPITAFMFLIGMASGIIASNTSMSNNAYTQSTLLWEDINAELLLIAFLPPLLFGDAFHLNISLLKRGFLQCFVMAFPLVLVGTLLSALVGYYVLPYNWNFWLCLAWGSILSATDPVAVSSLLKECGAPPRLRVMIAGESLLNDGSAIVFFTVFSQKWYSSLNILGFGKDLNVAEGFAVFFRMSLGAVVIGVPMGAVVVLSLRWFSRRFSNDDSVVQVIGILAVTYLNFYINDTLLFMSGVIAVVAQGIVIKAYGQKYLLGHFFHHFWEVLETILNSLIFAVGGVIFGGIVSNRHPLRLGTFFSGRDWGYGILVYILVNIIRFVLMFGAYPLISRIGLKWSIQEATFVSFSGLRGAIAIALATTLDSEVDRDTALYDPRRNQSTMVFGVTGVVVLLSLVVNGTFAGKILRRLSLVKPSNERKEMVEGHWLLVRKHVIATMSKVTKSNPRTFANIQLDSVRECLPSLLESIPNEELQQHLPNSVERSAVVHGQISSSHRNLIDDNEVDEGVDILDEIGEDGEYTGGIDSVDDSQPSSDSEDLLLKEQRLVFIGLLRNAYSKQIDNGELDVKRTGVVISLQRSVDYVENAVTQGKSLEDWDFLNESSDSIVSKCKLGGDRHAYSSLLQSDESKKVYRTIAFLRAHGEADAVYGQCMERKEASRESVSAIYKTSRVLKESFDQQEMAREYLRSVKNLSLYATDVLCDILVNAAANYILHLAKEGLLNEKEAEDMIHGVYSKYAKSSPGSVRSERRAEKTVEQDEENTPNNGAHES